MSVDEDTKEHFRRNLVVFCAFVVAGAFLNIPISKVIEKLLGIEVGQVSPARILLIQFGVFAYLLHRYYFRSDAISVWRSLLLDVMSDVGSNKFLHVKRLVDLSNDSIQPWGPCFSTTQEKIFAPINSARERESTPALEPSSFRIELWSLNEDSRWVYSASVRVHEKGRSPIELNGRPVSVTIPPIGRFKLYASAWLKTISLSSSTTEHVVPLVLAVATAVVILVRGFAPSLFGTGLVD